MAGTRRQLFKTSVLSALGLTSLGIVARASAQTVAPGRSPKDFAKLAECIDEAGRDCWLLLQPTSFGIEVYRVAWKNAPNYDMTKIAVSATITPAGNMTVTTKASYQGDPTAKLIVQNSYLLSPTGQSPLSGLSQSLWNEIGSRHNYAQ